MGPGRPGGADVGAVPRVLLGPLRRRRNAAARRRGEAVDAVHQRAGQVVVVTGKSEALAIRCIDSVRLEVDAVVGHAYGDEKRDALREHAAGIYVGDTVTDVKSAIDVSAIAVGVATGPDDTRALLAAGADIVLDSLEEFPAWLATVA